MKNVKKEKEDVKKTSSNKSSPFKYKREFIIAVVGVLLIVGIFLLIALGSDSKKNEDKDNNNDNEQTENGDNGNSDSGNNGSSGGKVDYGVSSEDTIIKVYGMSKEDAVNLVKKEFLSDNFEFSVEISYDVTYIVSVKNVATNKVIKYEVNPSTKEYYQI